jgi:drug/metabolite transporter (DMT)-like permease
VTVTHAVIVLWVAVAIAADICFKEARSWEQTNFWLGVVLHVYTAGCLAFGSFINHLERDPCMEGVHVGLIWTAVMLLGARLTYVLYSRGQRFVGARTVALIGTMIAMVLAIN